MERAGGPKLPNQPAPGTGQRRGRASLRRGSTIGLTIAAGLVLAAPAAAQQAPSQQISGQQMSDMPSMDHGVTDHNMPGMDMGSSVAPMTGALGPYAMSREASGTAWQPDASAHAGLHLMRGGWTLMLHSAATVVADSQHGPRGGDQTFFAGMVMGMARRDLGGGDTLQLRAMLSPDPLMGKRGYPLLLATGETAEGLTPLVDRQHPHDLFMELSASYSHRLSATDSVFVYAGLPGEPAFGPPAFMHRASIMDSPEAPISHHWLDSTHITFGVVTAGIVHGNWKAEVSRFKGREPDENRFDIENPKLDSTALRLSWNPTAHWSLQASWAEVTSPESLDPHQDQRKWSASAIYTVPLGHDRWWSTTAAWGQRTGEHGALPAWVLESALKPAAPWTVFGRVEQVDNDELVPGRHGPAYTVRKVSLGAIHDWRLAEHAQAGLGGLYAWNHVPPSLARLYGDEDPGGAMIFARLKIG